MGGANPCVWCVCVCIVWLVLGANELGGCRDEAEGETGRVVSGSGQFGPEIHPQSELQVAGGHTPHTHGALQR